jgi:hypothetical protein
MGWVTLSSIAILIFIMYVSHHSLAHFALAFCLDRSFAIGLGPVPFVMIPEVSPFHVRFVPHHPQRRMTILLSLGGVIHVLIRALTKL